MNGNQLANMLDDPIGGNQFKDFKDFTAQEWTGVMGKARKMAGPEGAIDINFPKKDLASEIDKILNSQDYMMLGPEDRAKVLKILQEIQTKKDTPVGQVSTTKATTPTKTTVQKEEPTYKREKAQGVQFRRVDGELIKEEADKWWEDLTPEQKIAKREAELGISESFRKKAVMREHPELQVPLEEREFKYKKEKELKDFEAEQAKELQEQFKWEEEKRIERDTLFEDKRKWIAEFGAEEATRMFDERMRLIEHEGSIKEINRRYELDVEKFGEEKAENKRAYNLDTEAEKHSWSELLYQRGFKDKEFIETSKQFWDTLDFNKTKEETRATEFGVTYELDTEKEANVMEQFEEGLKKEYDQLDLDVRKFGLDEKTKQRIHTLALMEVALKTKELGLEEAIQYFEEREAGRTEWWNKKDYELEDKEADRFLKETEAQIINDTAKTDLATAIHRENVRQFDEEMELEWAELDKEEGADFTLAIPSEFATTLSNLGAETQTEVMRLIKLTYNPKTGKNVYPGKSDRNKVTNFLVGAEDEEIEKEVLGCNLSLENYVNACLSYYDWTDQMKAYALRLKTDDKLWQGVINTARGLNVLEEEPEGAEKKTPLAVRMAEKIAGWWPFGKKETPAPEETTPRYTGDIRADANNIISNKGRETPERELRQALSDIGYDDEEINTLFGGQ